MHLEIPRPGNTASTPSNSSPSYPPSYHSSSDGEPEKEPKESLVNIRPIQFLKTRATTFGTLTGNELKATYTKTKRFITRSGSDLPSHLPPPQRSFLRQKFSGWRGGVLAAVVSAGSVLLVNLCFTIWAAAVSGSGVEIGVIYEGECSTIHTTGLWIHVAINVMGTVLLGSSNYTMQCLSSPTREEVDEAHSQGKYLDIGLPSLRNLRGWKKKALFGLLILSTLPLHFLWNSAVFTTTQELDYQVFVVTPEFLTGTSVDCSQYVNVQEVVTDDSYAQSINLYYRTALNGTPTTWNSSRGAYPAYFPFLDVCSTANDLQAAAANGSLVRLSNSECVSEYGRGGGAITDRGNLLVVAKQQPADNNHTVLLNFRYQQFVSDVTGNNWVCDPALLAENKYACDYKALAKTANETWNMGDLVYEDPNAKHWDLAAQWPIDYCLSQPTDVQGICKLQYSLIIMLWVLAANMIKFGVILYFLYTNHHPVLATIGDGISSFLARPDPYTAHYPLLDRNAAKKLAPPGVLSYTAAFIVDSWTRGLESLRKLLATHAPTLLLGPLGFLNRERHLLTSPKASTTPARWAPSTTLRWYNGPSRIRWFVTLILCTTAIISAAILLRIGNSTINNNYYGASTPYTLGFGNFYSGATLNIFNFGDSVSASSFASNINLILMVAVANIPQVLVSCLYFAYNTVYTGMVSADEWSRFTTHRKTLRTTDPVGGQRSTYWLSLPWTYALPLASASSILHWLISQALFVARTEILDTAGNTEPISYMEVGYSPLAILLALLFGALMVLVMVANGARKLKGGLLVANNSLAIAAACQRGGEEDAHLRPVRWGVVRRMEDREEMGHCCFSAEEVEMPEVGEVYI